MNVAKSFRSNDPIIDYCSKLTVKQTEIEKELCKNTFNLGDSSRMLGAPEVLQFGKNFIHLIGAKRCLDVGTFTGASALAWALAIPENGEVLSFDVDHSALNKAGLPVIKKHKEIEKKITFHLGPAVEKMDEMIANGESGKWDFAFIDADKENYPKYYQQCMKLLRSGGIIFIDNALWSGSVAKKTHEEMDESTKAIDAVNKMIAADEHSNSILLNVGDGLHVAFKK